MCAIFGAVSLDDHRLDAREQLEKMAHALRHRGPDGTKLQISRACALGVNRLAIFNRGSRADQPLTTFDSTFWLGCDGEIYNAVELRARFPAHASQSGSDAEPLLPLLAERGAAGLADVDGMFALAWWDSQREALVLARDRAGEKPLFYAELDREIWFASEIAALLLHPRVKRDVDLVGLSEYLRLGYVLEPRTLFAAIRRVEAGTALVLRRDGRSVVRYWEPNRIVTAPPPGDRIARLRELLESAVRRQVVADVPVGAFISGGLDSSFIAVLAARALADQRLTTFCARFAAASYDESMWARRCAQHIGARHIEVACGEEELRQALWALGQNSAEPISDPAVLPTFLLAREARRHVRVVLSGEGADELFGGYPTYLGHKFAPRYQKLPPAVRRTLAHLVARLPVSGRKVTLEFLLRRFIASADLNWIERHLVWFAVEQPAARDRDLLPQWLSPLLAEYRTRDPLAGAMLLDYCTGLREKLLVKSDRATMLNSIEARAPYLDWRLTQFAFSLSNRDKVRGLTTKWILKRAAMPLLPRATVLRRKRGLSVPVASLINGFLREEVDHWLEPNVLRSHELLDVSAVRRLLAEHRAGHADHARSLWPIIMLQFWAERWRPVMTDRVAEVPGAEHESPPQSDPHAVDEWDMCRPRA